MTTVNCNDIYTISAEADAVYKVKFPSIGNVCVKNDTDDVIQLHFVTSPDDTDVINIREGEAFNDLRVTGTLYITAKAAGNIGIVYRR